MTRHADGPSPVPIDPARSRNMAAIGRVDTRPELALRSALHRAGLRFRKDFRIDVAGTRVRPDIVFTRSKVAVFVDGCFWHCCPEHGVRPKSNADFWDVKLRGNVERDRRQDAALENAGWRVVRIWEHESLPAAVDAVLTSLGGGPTPGSGWPA